MPTGLESIAQSKMVNQFNSSNISKINKLKWYSKYELQRINLYDPSIEKGISKKNGKDDYFFGGSVISAIKSKFKIPFHENDCIEVITLSSALENPNILKYAKENPSLIIERNIEGNKIAYVPLSSIHQFKDTRPLEKRLAENEENKIIASMPELRLKLHELKYISDHRYSTVSDISEILKIPESVIEAAMYKLKIRDLPSKDNLLNLSQTIKEIHESKNRPWTVDETEFLREKYCITEDGKLSLKLRRDIHSINAKAEELGLEKINPNHKYHVLEALKITNLNYRELNSALYNNEVKFFVHKRKMAEGNKDMPEQCVLFIDGKSLAEFLKKDERMSAPETRRQKYERLVIKASKNYSILDCAGKMKASPTLSPEIEKELLEEVKEGSLLARDNLIEGNYKLAAHVAGQFVSKVKYLLEFDDLFQEGCIGLIHAAEKYDGRTNTKGKKAKFSTVATWWIMRSIIAAINEKGHRVKKPMDYNSKERKIAKVIDYFLEEYNREPTIDEIHAQTNISKKVISRVKRISNISFSSLDAKIGEDEESDMYNFLPSGDVEKEILEKIDRQEILSGLINRMKNILNIKEYIVLQKRYGIDGYPQTLDEVGKALGLTRERIRQLERDAKEKLSSDPSMQKIFSDNKDS